MLPTPVHRRRHATPRPKESLFTQPEFQRFHRQWPELGNKCISHNSYWKNQAWLQVSPWVWKTRCGTPWAIRSTAQPKSDYALLIKFTIRMEENLIIDTCNRLDIPRRVYRYCEWQVPLWYHFYWCLQVLVNIIRTRGIHTGCRLVKKEDFWICNQCPGQKHLLTRPPEEITYCPFLETQQPKLFKHRISPLLSSFVNNRPIPRDLVSPIITTSWTGVEIPCWDWSLKYSPLDSCLKGISPRRRIVPLSGLSTLKSISKSWASSVWSDYPQEISCGNRKRGILTAYLDHRKGDIQTLYAKVFTIHFPRDSARLSGRQTSLLPADVVSFQLPSYSTVLFENCLQKWFLSCSLWLSL